VRLPRGAESVSGTGSSREGTTSPSSAAQSNPPQDEVKVQVESPGDIAVYQFVDQQGSLVLQVPPQQIIELAQQIAQELAEESAANENVVREGREHGN